MHSWRGRSSAAHVQMRQTKEGTSRPHGQQLATLWRRRHQRNAPRAIAGKTTARSCQIPNAKISGNYLGKKRSPTQPATTSTGTAEPNRVHKARVVQACITGLWQHAEPASMNGPPAARNELRNKFQARDPTAGTSRPRVNQWRAVPFCGRPCVCCAQHTAHTQIRRAMAMAAPSNLGTYVPASDACMHCMPWFMALSNGP